MRKLLLWCFAALLVANSLYGAEWHVTASGSPSGNGSLGSPWDLQTALNQPASVHPGDIIWVHGGNSQNGGVGAEYHGRYKSYLNYDEIGTPDYITVSAWPGDTVVLNGNGASNLTETQKQAFTAFFALDEEAKADYKYTNRAVLTPDTAVLEVYGPYTIFMNLEITFLGTFPRNTDDDGFELINGLDHYSGVNCKFINLVIYNTPGIGVTSWKYTGGTEFNGCLIYNNGYIGTDRPHGPAMYIQNKGTATKKYINNVLFNSFWIGMEIWSASTCPSGCIEAPFVENIDVINNVVFNSSSPGFPGGKSTIKKTNILVASMDVTGGNAPKNINVLDNVLYHNTDFTSFYSNQDSPSLSIGAADCFGQIIAPPDSLVVSNNFVFGKNNALKLNSAEHLSYTNNTMWGRYVNTYEDNFIHGYSTSLWDFHHNTYYTNSGNAFRAFTLSTVITDDCVDSDSTTSDYDLPGWITAFGVDETGSNRYHVENALFNSVIINKVTQSDYNPNRFTVVLFNKASNDMSVDFSSFGIPNGTSYTIRDAEYYHTPITGTLTGGSITFNMQSTSFELPTNNTDAVKSEKNFGVFIVEFSLCETNLSVSTAVNDGDIDLKQASNLITASNTINVGGRAIYHGGNAVVLSNGFTAWEDSNFWAYQEGCDNIFIYRPPTVDSPIKSENTITDEITKTPPNYSVYPNPALSVISIDWSDSISEIKIYSIDGKLILTKQFSKEKHLDLDISALKKGLYILSIKNPEGKLKKERIIKQ